MKLTLSPYTLAILSFTSIVSAQDDRTCGSAASKQADYRGEIAITATGRNCQSWSSQSPHSHSRTPKKNPNSGLESNNCRNPDGEPKAWCYTADPGKRWEVCNVPTCADVTHPTIPGGDLTAEVTPEMLASKYGAPIPGWCVNAANGDAVDQLYQKNIYASDADGPSTCYNFCEPFTGMPGFAGM